jgi:hypothetical protein
LGDLDAAAQLSADLTPADLTPPDLTDTPPPGSDSN